MTEEVKMILDRIDKMDYKVTDIQLTIENVVCKNIDIIAEGHHDRLITRFKSYKKTACHAYTLFTGGIMQWWQSFAIEVLKNYK